MDFFAVGSFAIGLFAVKKIRRGTLFRKDVFPLGHRAVGTFHREDTFPYRFFAMRLFGVGNFAIWFFGEKKIRH